LDGGAGTDSYRFSNTTPVTLDWTLEYWIESDAGGSIRFNGNAIGNAVQFVDQIGVGASWIDDTGTTYAAASNTLWIWLPTNEAIYVNGWANGDMGIYLPGL
jgi:hypothetical protein